MAWSYPTKQEGTNIGDDYTINGFEIDVLSDSFNSNTKQIPFIFALPGPFSLRKGEKQSEAYKIYTGKKDS